MNYLVFLTIPLQSKGGSCIATAGKCILVGTFNENKGHSASGCNENVTELAKYLVNAKRPTAELVQRDTEKPPHSPEASWVPYIQDYLLGRGNVAQALICSKLDGSIYASTPNFTVSLFLTNESAVTLVSILSCKHITLIFHKRTGANCPN